MKTAIIINNRSFTVTCVHDILAIAALLRLGNPELTIRASIGNAILLYGTEHSELDDMGFEETKELIEVLENFTIGF